MREDRWIAYYRVSTQRQGESGLGLEAQRASVDKFLRAHDGTVFTEFTETESGKRASNRPELLAALALCRKHKFPLIIAKLDRLARNVHFISGLMETGVDFVAVDQPSKDRFMLHVQAAFAEEEARRISVRTKEALAAAKRRGIDIGATGRVLAQRHRDEALRRAREIEPVIKLLEGEGIRTVRGIQTALNSKMIPAPGGGVWHIPSLHRTLMRLRRNPISVI